MSPLYRQASGVKQFVDDDKGYLDWLDANPNGFVVNSERTPKPNYLVLHRTSCPHISSSKKSNWTTTGFIKTCSADFAALSRWVRDVVGGDLQPCGACKAASNGTPKIVAVVRPAAKNPPIPRQTSLPPPLPVANSNQGHRSIPESISTGCAELDLVWSKFARRILSSPILIPDTEDDLNWHSFLGHSIDMQGFRAAEFVGVDPLTKKARGFVSLKALGIGVPELGRLWEIEAVRTFLLSKTQGQPLKATLDMLKSRGGSTGRSLAEAFEAFPYRKGHWTVRAYLQNSAVLKEHGYSFRRWLENECHRLGAREFPPHDFRQPTSGGPTVEMALRRRLEKTFYQVGPALAAYMLCDWQLWLWNSGRTGVFANFKLDSFHEEFVKKYARGLIPTNEGGFTRWWLSLLPEIPPRLANECIWLGVEHKLV